VGDNLEVVGLEFDTRDFENAIRRAERRLDDLEDSIDRSGKAADRAEGQFLKTGKAVIGLVAAYGGFRVLETAGRFIFDTNREFEQLEARLISITGSTDAASQAFDLITAFASSTPFEIQNLTEAFTQLSAVGITPTVGHLEDLGNFAAAMGRDITEFASAVIRAGAGETEALKSFGVVARAEGDKLKVTFRGVTQEVNKDFGSVVELFREIARENFGDGMSRQMDTLDGSISNLSDTASLFAKDIGDQGVNKELTNMVRLLDQAIQNSDGLAVSLGGGLSWAIRQSGELLTEWALIFGELGGESSTAVGIKASLSKIKDPRVLEQRMLEFVNLMPDPNRSIDENDRLLKEAGLTGRDVDNILLFIQERLDTLKAGPGTTPSSSAPSAGIGEALADKISGINTALDEQIKLYSEGEEAAYRFKLAQDGIVGAAQDEIVEKWKQVEALEAEAEARKDAERQLEQNQQAIDGTLDSLHTQNMELAQGERALLLWGLSARGASKEQLELAARLYDANQQLIEQAELHEQNMRELEDMVRSAGGAIEDSFLAVINRTESVAEAFDRMVDSIIADLIRLAFQRAILEPLIGSIFDDGGAVSDGGGAMAKGSPIWNTGPKGSPSSAFSIGGPNKAVVVNLNQNLNVSAIDTRGATQVIREQKGEILQMMAEGIQESTTLQQLMGGRR